LFGTSDLKLKTTQQEYTARSNGASGTSAGSFGGRYNMKYSSYLNDEPMPDAASEKEQVGTSAESLPFFYIFGLSQREALAKLKLMCPASCVFISREMNISNRRSLLKQLSATPEVLGCLLQQLLLQIEPWRILN
jgi:hypothetical protein